MARPTPLSGFPEWLPNGRIVEQHVLDTVRRVFELHGFASIETRAVEPVSQLVSKGETSKEIYLLSRLQAGEERQGSEKQLGLHFDLTVPFARYVVENAGQLAFPFKRYQIQKVWRGERPQDGRFREFVQADIDVVGQGSLPYHYEVELPLVMAEALGRLAEIGLPPVRVLVNNRKVAEGFYRGLGLASVDEVLRAVDKLDKIGPDAVAALIESDAGASADQARACLELAAISGDDRGVIDRVRALAQRLDVAHPTLDEGLVELEQLLVAAATRAPGVVVADLKIARGLDYYTGSVYETVLVGHEELGSICSGGRYDTLASDGKQTYPGVGLSIGITRVVSRLLSAGLARATRSVPTAVVVAVFDESHRAASDDIANRLRARGISAETSPDAAKFGKQIRYADRRGIPFVWFPAGVNAQGERTDHQVKDIRSGDQVAADPDDWAPPSADLAARVVPLSSASASTPAG